MKVLTKNGGLDMGPRPTSVRDMSHRTYRDEIYGENGDATMPVEIKVGQPVITINQGSTFMVTDQRG